MLFSATFGLSLACYDVMFFVVFVAMLYLCGNDSNKQNIFDQLNIYYGHQYVEKLKSKTF